MLVPTFFGMFLVTCGQPIANDAALCIETSLLSCSHQHARDLNEKAAFDREVDKLNKIVQSFGPYKCIEGEWNISFGEFCCFFPKRDHHSASCQD